jgi:hypothetical protein
MAPMRRQFSARLFGARFVDDRILDAADLVDLHLDDIARLEEYGRFLAPAGAFAGASGQQVTWLQRHHRGKAGDLVGDWTTIRPVLNLLAQVPLTQRRIVSACGSGMSRLVTIRDRSGHVCRMTCPESTSALTLPVAGRDIVHDRVLATTSSAFRADVRHRLPMTTPNSPSYPAYRKPWVVDRIKRTGDDETCLLNHSWPGAGRHAPTPRPGDPDS